jgi:hypothetical protein
MSTRNITEREHLQRFLVEVLVAWAVCTPAIVGLFFFVTDVLSHSISAEGLPKPETWSWPRLIWGFTLGPAIESLLMVPVFALWRWLGLRRMGLLAVASATTWALAHGYLNPWWGAFVFWPFLIFSFMYLRWETVGWKHAVGAATAVHALHNLTGILVAAAQRASAG